MQPTDSRKLFRWMTLAIALIGMPIIGVVLWISFVGKSTRPETANDPRIANPAVVAIPAEVHALNVPGTALPDAVDLSKLVKTTDLPGTLIDIAIGANGRLLVLRLREMRALQVYDVATRKIVGTIPADDDPICFAAGKDKLLLGLWGQAAIQRWDLPTLTMESERVVPGDEAPLSLAMGANSAGPVLAVKSGGGSVLLDLETLEPGDFTLNRQVWKHYPSSQHRASADGSVFCSWDFNTLVAGVNLLQVSNGIASYTPYDDSVGHVCPDEVGNSVYTAVGRYAIQDRPSGQSVPSGFLIPAVSGTWFLRIQEDASSQSPRFEIFAGERPEPVVSLMGLTFAQVADIHVRRGFDSKLKFPIPPDRRLILIPAVNEIVGVGLDQKSLHHWPFDFARWQ